MEKERSETILAHVADGIVAVDRDGKVVLWNEAASRITGVERGDVLGRDPAEVLKRSARRSGERGRRNAHPRHPARRRGGVALAERGGDARSDRGDRGADLHVPGRLRPAARRADEVRDSSPPSRTSCARRSLPSTASPRRCSATTSTSATRSGARSSSTSSSESERLTAIVDTLLNVARLEAGRPSGRARADRSARARRRTWSSTPTPAVMNGHEFVVELPDQPLEAQADDEKLRQVLINLGRQRRQVLARRRARRHLGAAEERRRARSRWRSPTRAWASPRPSTT